MITFDEKIIAIWFVELPKADWLAAVREVVPEKKYELTYRFRYHVDDKAFDSKDKKSWYQGTVSGTKQYVILSIRSTANELSKQLNGGKMWELLNDEGFDTFVRKFQNLPFNYMRMGTPEESAALTEGNYEQFIERKEEDEKR
jgi:hypothetical protein